MPNDEKKSFIDYTGKGPKGYWPSDERIREKACEALYNDPYVDASEIEVQVRDGIVTLKGAVTDRKMKKMAQSCIEDGFGVRDVINVLELRPDLGLVGDMNRKARLL
jgi:osmotically-inducible protein OsmY